jgi:peptide/nickel transport system substrate-binding protein
MVYKVLRGYRPWEKFLTLGFLAVFALGLILFVFKLVFGFIFGLFSSDVYAEATYGDLPQINPLYAEVLPVNRDLSRLIYAGLVRYNPESREFVPDLADFNVNAELTEYRFQLKDGLKWHDGEALTAKDVVFTFNDVIKNPNFPNQILAQAFVDASVEAVSEREVVFKLKNPNAYFLSNLIVGLLPYHLFSEVPVAEIGQEFDDKSLVGAGPFMVTDLLIEDDAGYLKFELKRFADYVHGKPGLKRFDFYVFADLESLLNQQELFAGTGLIPDQPATRLGADFERAYFSLPQYTALFLNQSNSILATERMRKVLKNLFDKNYLASTLKSKQVIAGPYFFLEELDKIPDRALLLLSKQLDSYGWRLNSATGIRENDKGEKLKFILLAKNQEDQDKNAEVDIVLEHIVDSAREVGILIELDRVDASTYAAKLVNKSYDIVLAGQDLGYNLDAFAFWHSSQTGPETVNLSNFANISADKILEQLRREPDQTKQFELLKRLNETLKAEAPAIFLYTQKYLFTFDNSLKNRTILDAYATISDRFYGVHEWKR